MKISTFVGGRILILMYSLYELFLSTVIIWGCIVESLEYLILAPVVILLLFPAFRMIRYGFWQKLHVCDDFIKCNNHIISKEDVRFTLSSTRDLLVFGRGIVDIIYIDDHYLTNEEISRGEYKMSVILRRRMLKNHLLLISWYNNKIVFNTEIDTSRHAYIIAHNEKISM